MATPTIKKTDFTADVVVIGAGLHGCSSALHMALRGLSVIVLEKDHAGRHASGVNAGGVRRLGRHFSEIPISAASAAIWQNITDIVEDDCGFESSFQIRVAETEEKLAELEDRARQVRELGFHHETIIDRETVRELLPHASPHCVGGMMVVGDGYANPFRTVQAFKRKCKNLGVHFRENTKVTNIRRDRGVWYVGCHDCVVEAPSLVNNAGAWGGVIAKMIGETVPITAIAPMLMITARMPPFVTGVVGAQGRAFSLKQFANGTVLVSGGHRGTADIEANTTSLNYAGLTEFARITKAIFPITRNARIVRAWGGIEGIMPDEIPVISQSQADGAFHGFGFSAHGFQLGPIGGRIMSDLVIDGGTNLPIAPFRIDRF